LQPANCRYEQKRRYAQKGVMSIIDNRKATHDYFIEDRYEAGLVLQGWEVKAIRDGRVQLKESYVIVRDGELYLLGMHVTPMPCARASCCSRPRKSAS